MMIQSEIQYTIYRRIKVFAYTLRVSSVNKGIQQCTNIPAVYLYYMKQPDGALTFKVNCNQALNGPVASHLHKKIFFTKRSAPFFFQKNILHETDTNSFECLFSLKHEVETRLYKPSLAYVFACHFPTKAYFFPEYCQKSLSFGLFRM